MVNKHGMGRLGFWLTAAAALAFASTSFADGAWPRRVTSGTVAAGFSEEGIETLDAAMAKIVDDQDVAGMVWLLVKDGKVVTYDVAGYNRVEDKTPMTKDSLFRIYSMTKPVTGVAMMMLHEQGLWNFDDPVSMHAPELGHLKLMSSFDEDGNIKLTELDREPTMRELLNHSAGFGYGLGGSDPVNNAFREQGVLASRDLNELMDKVADIPLLFQPGERWSYSIAVDIQGYIVERLSGQKFGDFLHNEIFAPLSMNDTQFYVEEKDRDRFAEVHYWDSEQKRLRQQPPRTDRPGYFDAERIESGGGGLVSSTHDYARFLQLLVNEGELDGHRLLSPESVRIMRTNSLRDELNLRGSLTSEGQPGVGFGVDFAVISDPKAANSPHGAGTYYWGGAAGTWFWIDPTLDMFWIGMIQAQGPRRPDAPNMQNIARNIIYSSLIR